MPGDLQPLELDGDAHRSGAYEVVPLTSPPDVTVRVPGSKSITNRTLLCAMLDAVHAFGAQVTVEPDSAEPNSAEPNSAT